MLTIAQALALGLQHHQAGRLAEAEAIYLQVLREQPRNTEALNRLGALLIQAGRRDEAVAHLEQAVALAPDNSLYQGNLGSAYVMVGRHEMAEAPLQEAIRLDPQNAAAHYNLGLMMEQTSRTDEAIVLYRQTVALQPANRAAHNNLGTLLRAQRNESEALAHFDAALAADPQAPHVHYNRAMLLLSMGRLAEGWQEYEWRLRCREFVMRRLPTPQWDGAPLQDKTLLVHAEQGQGDTIQFLRYLPLVRGRCPHTLFEVPAPLLPICRHSGMDGLVVQPEPAGGRYAPPTVEYDCQVPLLRLPRIFETTMDSISANVPYLTADEDRVAAWHTKLSSRPGFRIGICWQGSPTHRDDQFRSFPLSQFAPLARVDGVRLYSLQKGHGSEQIEALGGQFPLDDLQRAIAPDADPWMDVAAIMKNLDLVVTCDTSVAHLAGALGVPVWVALAARVDWRWMLDRADSPWYPTMRLFRQQRLGDWEGVFHQMATELRAIVGPDRASTIKL